MLTQVNTFLAKQASYRSNYKTSSKKITKESIQYKNRIAGDKEFAAKVLWAVDEQVNLFLSECRRCDDRENVNEQFINFDELHMSILLHRFNITLPSNFHKKTPPTEPAPGKENDPNKKGGGGKCKGDNKEDKGGCKRDNRLVNNDQVPEFKMKDGEMWEKTFRENASTRGSSWTVPSCAHASIPKGTAGKMDASSPKRTSQQMKFQARQKPNTCSTWHAAGHLPLSANRESGRGLVVPDNDH